MHAQNCQSNYFIQIFVAGTADVMTTKPEMWDVIQIVFPKIKAKWKYVAHSMRYDCYAVNAFEQDSDDLNERCYELFEDWLTTDRGITPKM